MANIAALRQNLVVCIAPTIQTLPAGLVYDTTRDAAGANVGDTWNGSAYVRPPVPVEQSNEAALREQAEQALSNLRIERDRSYTGLTAAQAIALIVPALKLVIRVQIGIIRLLINKFDGTE